MSRTSVMSVPPELMGLTEIGELFEVSRQRAGQLAEQEGFPEPVAVLAAGRIWERDDVERWGRRTGRFK
jgi:prophage regulatory protein